MKIDEIRPFGRCLSGFLVRLARGPCPRGLLERFGSPAALEIPLYTVEEEQLSLKSGACGIVLEVDGHGDTKIDFPFSARRQWAAWTCLA